MVQSYLSSETEIEGLHGVLLSFIHKSSSNCFLFFNTASTVAIRGGGIKTEINYLTTRDNNVETHGNRVNMQILFYLKGSTTNFQDEQRQTFLVHRINQLLIISLYIF